MSHRPSSLLYHYTGAAGLIGIAQSKKLWATDHRHLNDRKEHRVGSMILKEEFSKKGLEKRYKPIFDTLFARTRLGYFVLSFSERGDLLSQWRAYSGGGYGYSLGFSQANPLFVAAQQLSFNLIQCEYKPEKQRELCRQLVEDFERGMATSWHPGDDVPSKIRSFMERYQWSLKLALTLSAIKQEGFEEEREWRLVSQYPDDRLHGMSFRTGRFGVTPYFELPIKSGDLRPKVDEVIIGPTQNPLTAQDALKLLFTKNAIDIGSVKQSRTPLRHF